MFTYEKTMTGKGKMQKIWNLYSNVHNWSLWDKSIKHVQLSGEFFVGTNGIMEMTNGLSLPFTITECVEGKRFTTESKLGSVIVTFGHFLEERSNNVMITHTVTIEGGEEEKMKDMGRGITAGIPDCLQQLLSMVKE